jgi:hypothetical protein
VGFVELAAEMPRVLWDRISGHGQDGVDRTLQPPLAIVESVDRLGDNRGD